MVQGRGWTSGGGRRRQAGGDGWGPRGTIEDGRGRWETTGDGRVLDILGCSPKLSHTFSLVAIGYGAYLSSLRSVSFRFSSLLFPLSKFFLHSQLKQTKLLLT